MFIGVFSDSHGKYHLLQDAMKVIGPVDMIIHAGDYFRDARKLAEEYKIPIIGVVGNCDGFTKGPREEIVELAGHKVLITHGHQDRVKVSLDDLFKKAQKNRVELVIYGHTHLPDLTVRDNIIFFNPGSVGSPRTGQSGTYGLLEITEKDIIPHHRELPNVFA